MPQNNRQALQWVEAHIEPWTDNAAAIGLDASQVSSLASLAAAARARLTAAETRRETSKSATLEFNGAATDMKSLASLMVSTFKNCAESSGDESVYALADVSPASPRSPSPPPNQPTDLRWAVTPTGRVQLSWKASGNFATFY